MLDDAAAAKPKTHKLQADIGTLMIAGAGLLSVQYVAAREVGSTFFSTELSVAAAVIVTLLGPSLGYALGERFSSGVRTARWLSLWTALAVLLQLALPVAVRALVGALGEAHPIMTAVSAYCAVAIVCAYYALLLPMRATVSSLPLLYAAELGGAMIALLACFFAPSWRAMLLVYCALPVAAVYFSARRRWVFVAAAAAACAWLAYPTLDQRASQRYYASYHHHTAPRLIDSTYSPYQRVDVIEDNTGRSLYLDGVPFFRSGELTAFNEFLAEVPGALLSTRGSALVLGSGSFSSAARLHRLGYAVTVVELDAAVAAAGLRYFQAVHRLAPTDITLIIDDGRAVLSRSTQRYDLIVLDVPAPYRVQTALLHTPNFYRQVAAHLHPGGVASLSLCDGIDGQIGRRIAASALAAFGEVAVIESESVSLGILYAAARLPFSIEAMTEALRARDDLGGRIYTQQNVKRQTLGAAPLSDKDLFGVLLLSRQAHVGD